MVLGQDTVPQLRRISQPFKKVPQWHKKPIRSGVGASEAHCLNLSGTCRKDICRSVEDEIGACRRRWKCCRIWWILVPVPTPLINSDYQEPLKYRLK
ncbi:beta-defensin 109-like [Dugong dugon]